MNARKKMEQQIKSIKEHIEYLSSQYILAGARDRAEIMGKKIAAQGMLDKLEDAYYFGRK